MSVVLLQLNVGRAQGTIALSVRRPTGAGLALCFDRGNRMQSPSRAIVFNAESDAFQFSRDIIGRKPELVVGAFVQGARIAITDVNLIIRGDDFRPLVQHTNHNAILVCADGQETLQPCQFNRELAKRKNERSASISSRHSRHSRPCSLCSTTCRKPSPLIP